MDKILIFKAVSRVFHLLSAGYLIGSALTKSSGSWGLDFIMWLLAMISGLSNMIILIMIKRPDKKAHFLWKYMLYLKLVLLIPLNSDLLRAISSEAAVINSIRIFVVIIILLISVFSRFYREDVTKSFTLGVDSANEFSKFSEEDANKEDQMRRHDS